MSTIQNWRELTKEAWKQRLTQDQYRVLREADTERPFTGAYWNDEKDGMYCCAGCDTPLFDSVSKFDAGCGWPSFTAPTESSALEFIPDNSEGMKRTEVRCHSCGGHLGHIFDDGPGGLPRYCINSASLHRHDR